MWRKALAAFLSTALTTTACASASARLAVQSPQPLHDRAVLGDYLQRLAAGSRIRVERSGGEVLRGILINATADGIVVQQNTRIPEKPVDIPLADIARVSLDANTSSVGKVIGIGVAAGVAATLGVIGVLATIWSD